MNGRDKRRRRAERAKQNVICPNCDRKGRHYVPASFGEPGFFTCEYPIADDLRSPLGLRNDAPWPSYRGRGA